MSLLNDKKVFADRRVAIDKFFQRLDLAIYAFEHTFGYSPAAILLNTRLFWETQGDHRIIHRPGHIVEYQGIRVIPAPDLDDGLYLAEGLHRFSGECYLEAVKWPEE